MKTIINYFFEGEEQATIDYIAPKFFGIIKFAAVSLIVCELIRLF